MKCPRCGNRLKSGIRFCGRCGFENNQNVHPVKKTGNAKFMQKKWPMITAITLAVLSLATVGVLVFIKSGPGNQTGDSSPFSSEILPGFTFDDEGVIELAGEPAPEPEVTGLTPASGTVGTKVRIKGRNIVSAGLQAVMLGKTELSLHTVSDSVVEAHVPDGASSGKISLVYPDKTVEAGSFKVLPQEKQLLAKKTIGASKKSQTVKTDTIAVTIPANALDSKQTVKIERIANPQPVNLPESVSGTAFSVTVGDVHEFDDTVTIDFTLPSNLPGEPSAAYYDDSAMLWRTLPSKIIDGKLRIYTDHLTDFFVFYWGEAVYSPGGYFKIYYHKDDKHNFGSSMDDLAKKVGVALEEARKDYEAKIPKAYRENFTYLGIKDAMDVYLDSDYSKGTYNAVTNNILLPTNFPSSDDFETMAAHELFHSYQDAVWNEIKGIGKMSNAQNMWAVEAMAELAAYELAFPEKHRERHITGGVSSQDPYYTFDSIHEYSMSCFLRYLLRETNSTFDKLWISVASSGKTNLAVCINDFFKSQSSDFISLDMSYMDFWRDVIDNSDAPLDDTPDALFYKRKMYFKANQHTAAFQYQTIKASTAAFNLFAVKGYSENVPLRIFNVECTSGSAGCAQVPGILYANELNNARTKDGYGWEHLYKDTTLGNSRQLYQFQKGKNSLVLVLLEGVQANAPYEVRVSEIQAQSKPAKIENAVSGKEQEIELAFKDIFAYAKEVEVEIDFGDGEVKNYKKTNENGILSGKITHTFGEITGNAVTCALYDVTQGKKELISKLVIPITKGETVTLSASPNPVEPGGAVDLKTNVAEAGYTYEWEYGDGATGKTDSAAYTSHVYDSPGTYSVSVTVYDADGKRYGKAQQTVTVLGPAQTPGQTPEPTETGQPKGDPELVGTWQHTSEVYDSDIEGMDGYSTVTMQLKEDGTFVCEVRHIYIEPSYPWEQPEPTITTGTYEGGNLYKTVDGVKEWTGSYEFNNGVFRMDGFDFQKIE